MYAPSYMTLDPGRRKKDFLTNFFDDIGKGIGGVLRDVGNIPIIRDIGKAIHSEQIKKDLDKFGADVGNVFKSTKEKNKGILDGGTIPLRQDSSGSGGVAPFIAAEDADALQLVKMMVSGSLTNYGEYELQGLGDRATRVWINKQDKVIVVIKETDINSSKGLSNILDDIQLALSGGCNLAQATSASVVLDDIIGAGYTDITVAGWSLGGAAALCVASKYPKILGIGFNNVAFPTKPSITPSNGKSYHIVGDITSSHIGGNVVRIYLVESGLQYDQTPNQLQVDGLVWDDVPYYHSLERFFDHGREYKIVDAQYEQNALENFAFKRTLLASAVDVVGALTSQALNPFKRLQKIICSNPIPGSVSSRSCKEDGPEIGAQIAGSAIGGAIGAVTGLFTGGVLSAPAAGVGAGAGLAVASGEKGLFDFIPGVTDGINSAIKGFEQAAPGIVNGIQLANTTFASDQIVRGVKRARPGPVDSLVKKIKIEKAPVTESAVADRGPGFGSQAGSGLDSALSKVDQLAQGFTKAQQVADYFGQSQAAGRIGGLSSAARQVSDYGGQVSSLVKRFK